MEHYICDIRKLFSIFANKLINYRNKINENLKLWQYHIFAIRLLRDLIK